jgi:hypothetical protein
MRCRITIIVFARKGRAIFLLASVIACFLHRLCGDPFDYDPDLLLPFPFPILHPQWSIVERVPMIVMLLHLLCGDLLAYDPANYPVLFLPILILLPLWSIVERILMMMAPMLK